MNDPRGPADEGQVTKDRGIFTGRLAGGDPTMPMLGQQAPAGSRSDGESDVGRQASDLGSGPERIEIRVPDDLDPLRRAELDLKVAELRDREAKTQRDNEAAKAEIDRLGRELAMREDAQKAKDQRKKQALDIKAGAQVEKDKRENRKQEKADRRAERKSVGDFIGEIAVVAVFVAVAIVGLLTQASYLAYSGFGAAALSGIGFTALARKRGRAEGEANAEKVRPPEGERQADHGAGD